MDKQEQNTSTAPDSTLESPVSEGKLNSAKQKLGALADKAKQHDFKGDAKAAAESAKALKESLKKHDFKAELKEAFAEARKSPASIWKKPETPRPGKELAVTGLAVAIILFLLSIPFSGAVLGLVFLILSVAALLLCLLGLKTEGRKLAIGGTTVGLLVIFCSLGQIFGSSNRGEEDAEDATSKVAVTNEQESMVVKEYPLLSEAVTNEQESTNVDEYPLLIENEGEEASNVEEILEMAENAKKMESLNFYGFYTGMSFKNAKKLRSHYDLNEKQLWFKWSKKNGEVYGMYFTPKALTMIMDVANNFETVELTMQGYLGIVAWNNEKEVTKGEVDSLFQDDTDKFLWGDAANVARWYKTADGVLAKLSPTGWNSSGKAVFTIWDPGRGNPGQKFNRRFDNNNKMRKERMDLINKGFKTRLLKLPHEYECLLRESDGCWVNQYGISKEIRNAIFGNPSGIIMKKRKGIHEIDLLVESLNSMSSELKGDLSFAADEWSELGAFFFAGPKDKMDVLAKARTDKTKIAILERDYKEAWLRYNSDVVSRRGTERQVFAPMTEKEYKEEYFLQRGFILENGQYRSGTEEELSKARAESRERRKEAVDKAKSEENARVAAAAAKKAAEEKARWEASEKSKAQHEKQEVEKIVKQLESAVQKAAAELKRATEGELALEQSFEPKLMEIAKLRADATLADSKSEEFKVNDQIPESTEQWRLAQELKGEADYKKRLLGDAWDQTARKLGGPSVWIGTLSNIVRSAESQVNQLETREKAARENAARLEKTGPTEAVADWTSAADALKASNLRQQKLAKDAAKLLEDLKAKLTALESKIQSI